MAVNLIQSKPLSDPLRWVTIYPAYIDSKKTKVEGRKISKSMAVENPTTPEIYDILNAAGMKIRAERKMYPRDGTHDWMVQGRVRVHIKNDDGSLVNAKFPDRMSLFKYVAEMIPKLKSRVPGAAGQTAPAQASSGGGGGGGGKKNKKKK